MRESLKEFWILEASITWVLLLEFTHQDLASILFVFLLNLVVMKKEKGVTLKAEELPGRLTRARAATLRASGHLPPLKGVAHGKEKQPQRANPRKAVSDDTCLPRKKRAALQDVTNVCSEKTYSGCCTATKIQAKKSKLDKGGLLNASKVVPSAVVQLPQLQVDSRSENAICSVKLEDNALRCLSANWCGEDDSFLDSEASGICNQPLITQKKAVQIGAPKKGSISEHPNASKDPDVINIDADFEDPQLCCIYSSDIYDNLRVAELSRRPDPKFIETVQRDITPSMLGILVDWLVEVSEEYQMVPDTLYLTVYLIDWFLSINYIERHRLQLLGITCMLIASKYEEINAPQVEEFCLITDNTYKKEEVLKMEIQVLKSTAYKLCTPTTKTFLRRFLRAAQASYKSPNFELEYLANYLAELTLMNYGFLKFLPSMIAASAVFLARWTIDQSSHPWNATLQHYASYKASDLKTTVLALQDLQNSNDCPLAAIRTKYRQDKFKCVAALSSPKLLETLF